MSEADENTEFQAFNGSLLLASPALNDGIFNRSVIFLSEHEVGEGAAGVILNHPLEHVVGDLVKAPEFHSLRNLAVFDGGPVARGQLTFSAFWWDAEGVLRCQSRLDTSTAVDFTKQPGMVVRAFVGYSGWSAGQLENEMKHRSWMALKPPRELLTKAQDKSLWAEILRPISPYHRILAEAPDDPSRN